MLTLCHKCAGVLAARDGEDRGLHGCGCISGWARGFEPALTREQAIAAQIANAQARLGLYQRQGRDASWMEAESALIAKLRTLA